MSKKLSNKELKAIYDVDKSHKWMKIKSDDEKANPYFYQYKKQKNRLKRLKKYMQLNKKLKVAEFGCGNGLWGELICGEVKSYTGVDFSKSFISLAKERHKYLNIQNSQFVCEEIVKFSKKHTGEYDQAYSMDFSEHIYDADFISIFSAIRDTLKTGGTLYIHTPNEDYVLELLKKLGVLKQPIGHIGVRNGEKYIKLLKKIGFKNIKVLYLPHYLKLLSFFHFVSYIPWVGKYFKARLLIVCTK